MIRPLKSNVLVKVLDRDDYSNSLGLIVVDRRAHWQSTQGRRQVRKGEVIAAGPWATSVKPGDIVIFEADAGKWVDAKIGEAQLYRSLKQRDIEAVIDREEVAA